MSDQPSFDKPPSRYEFLAEERRAYFDRWRLNVEPMQISARAWTSYAVGYGQMGLKAALIVNGGALIAFPAFAEMMGPGLWVRGALLPVLGLSAFLIGLIMAGCGTACAYFAVSRLSNRDAAMASRLAEYTNKQYEASLKGGVSLEPFNPDARSETEANHHKWGVGFDAAATYFGLGALVSFVIGAVLAIFLIGSVPEATS